MLLDAESVLKMVSERFRNLLPLVRSETVDPISARIDCDVGPQFSRFRRGGESFYQIRWHYRFQFLSCGCDLEGDNVAFGCARERLDC
jgi:hypothetical protein